MLVGGCVGLAPARHHGTGPGGNTAREVTIAANRSLVLIVDDDALTRRALRTILESSDYAVVEAATGEAAIQTVLTRSPAAILLDLGLPDIDGTEVCRRLRDFTQLPILVISARGDDSAKVDALDYGADDYLTKPYSVPELLARLRAALRRAGRPTEAVVPLVRAGDLVIDLARRVVTRGGQPVHLTATEYRVLRTLATYPGRRIPADQLVRLALGPSYEDDVAVLRIYIARLRKKLEPNPVQPRLIITEIGLGYYLNADPSAGAAPGGGQEP